MMKAAKTDLFFNLVQLSIGTRDELDSIPTDEEWQLLYVMATKQSMSSFLFQGVEKTFGNAPSTKPKVFYEWFATQQGTVVQNELQNKRIRQIFNGFKNGGFRTCVLKGQGTAQYYDNPQIRQCGDIDLWVEGERHAVLEYIKSQRFLIHSVDVKHADVAIFNDVPVEIHFKPSWMYSPCSNKVLKDFFKAQADKQFSNYDEDVHFTHTTLDFDLVYSVLHIYRHIFSEGIGLRQLMDYFYILKHTSVEQRQEAMKMLTKLKMPSFVAGIMWILESKFAMPAQWCLCKPCKKHGHYLLGEIMKGGNFGQYDDRHDKGEESSILKVGFSQFKRNLRFISYYPSEVIWSPFWKTWHYVWRKYKGYI